MLLFTGCSFSTSTRSSRGTAAASPCLLLLVPPVALCTPPRVSGFQRLSRSFHIAARGNSPEQQPAIA